MKAFDRIVGSGLLAAVLAMAGLNPARAAEVKPRQLVTQFSCAEVQGIEADLGKAQALSPDAREEVRIIGAKCAAEAYNQAHPDQKRAVLVAPDAKALATDNKVYLRTVALADAAGISDYCAAVGGPVVTDKGPVACDAYVRAAREPLIVLVPSSVAAPAVTARILSLIGSGDPDGHLPYAEQQVAKAVRASAARTSDAVAAAPVITVASTGAGGTVSGTGGQFLHAGKCVTSLGFLPGCDRK